ncbi:MAG: hypothetical protein N838_27650 [Thiohalocapsa sp. PB-PSB1]|jgi:hypothetical protein|nr:MAG: hypothetical protein N838_27650 [Thiohalocapsa sp. PB-PSB1]
MILALGRLSVANEPEVKKLDKDWANYRKEHRLDVYGKPEISAKSWHGATPAHEALVLS